MKQKTIQLGVLLFLIIGFSFCSILMIPMANATITESESLPTDNAKIKVNTNYNFTIFCDIDAEELINGTLFIQNLDLETTVNYTTEDVLGANDTFAKVVLMDTIGHFNCSWLVVYNDTTVKEFESDSINFTVYEPKDSIWSDIADFFTSFRVKLIILFIIVISALVLAIIFIKKYRY